MLNQVAIEAFPRSRRNDVRLADTEADIIHWYYEQEGWRVPASQLASQVGEPTRQAYHAGLFSMLQSYQDF